MGRADRAGRHAQRRRGLRQGRAGLVGLVAAATLAAGLAPADPATAAPPEPQPRPLRLADQLADPLLFGTPGTSGVADGDGIPLATSTQPVAPGAELTSFDRLESDKWLSAHALSVDLDSGARVDYLASETVTQRETLTDLVAAHDPGDGRTTVAAINADFFDINETGAPLGPGLKDGQYSHSATDPSAEVVGFGPDSAGRILDLYFQGTLTLPEDAPKRTYPLQAYNAADLPVNGVGVYDSRWGAADRAWTVTDAERVTEVTVEDGRVSAVSDEAGDAPVPPGSTVLLGRDTGAATLAELAPGDPVSWEYAPRTRDGSPVPRTAVGGRGLLVVDGEPQDWEGRPNNTTAPRTAVGFSQDGSTLHVLTVDGRQAHSGGVTLTELGLMMDGLGAHNAINLDGGGSSALLARAPGEPTPQLVNSPSDGAERPVPNGLAITVPQGDGALDGLRVEPAADAERAPTTPTVPHARFSADGFQRVFPGLSRQLTAIGHDATYGPVADPRAVKPRWRVSQPKLGRVDQDGTFRARQPGDTRVLAARDRVRGSTELTVLGPLERIEPTTRRVGLSEPGARGTFALRGLDATGHDAPIDVADVRLEYDRALFQVVPDPDTGSFTVTARDGTGDDAAGRITATVAGKATEVAVTVGLREVSVADFEDADRWEFSAARASGSLEAVEDGRDGGGLQLTYDFGQSTATRAAYATPPVELEVSGQPESFQLWIKGDGQGAWPSLHLKDAQGTDQVLRGEHLDFSGWRQVTFAMPPGVSYPVRVHRFYLAETRADAAYQGSVTLDGLTASTPPDVDLPPQEEVADPLVSSAVRTADRDWRFAVVSDAQFVAREPDSEIVRKARRTLREVRAARPDFVVVNGDWVDEGAPEDLAFARQVLEEELGDAVPWKYVPGNHEVMGGSIDAFRKEFGDPQLTFDHRGTRFVTLDTSSLSLRGGGHAQLRELREQLDAAATDRSISSVVVVSHVPPRDPTPQAASQLADRLEAALLERWLADFRASTGKGVAFVGSHVGVFHASRVDGVPYLVNGDAGKRPAAAPEDGGFTGWSLVGVDRVSPAQQRAALRQPHRLLPDWISVQTRAHVDDLRLEVPDRVRAGQQVTVRGTVVQGSGAEARQVPVGFPLSADWSGSRNLHVGAPQRSSPDDIAVFDPVSSTLTALRPGTLRLELTVGGERREVTVTVSRR